jgi:hypothetical protein
MNTLEEQLAQAYAARAVAQADRDKAIAEFYKADDNWEKADNEIYLIKILINKGESK